MSGSKTPFEVSFGKPDSPRSFSDTRWAQHTSASLSFHLEQSSLDKVEAASVDVLYSSRAYRSDDEKSLLNQKEATRVPRLTKRSVEVGDCSEYTKVPTYTSFR